VTGVAVPARRNDLNAERIDEPKLNLRAQRAMITRWDR